VMRVVGDPGLKNILEFQGPYRINLVGESIHHKCENFQVVKHQCILSEWWSLEESILMWLIF